MTPKPVSPPKDPSVVRDLTTREPAKGVSFLLGVLCLVVPFLLYSPSVRAPFIFDDFSNIVENRDLRNPDAIGMELLNARLIVKNRQAPTRPVTSLTFVLNYRLNGLDPKGYRLFNIAVHAANTFLVFFLTVLVFRRLTDPVLTQTLAFAGAMLFCVHPLQTEAVAYISHRSDSLAAFFYLSTMLLFFAGRSKSWLYSVAPSAITFILASGSKEWTYATLPASLLFMDMLIFSRPEKPRFWRHAPFWVLAITLLVTRRILTGRWGFLGAQLDQVWTPLSYFGTQTYVWLKYSGLWFLPLWQTFDHYLVPGVHGLGIKVVTAVVFWSSLVVGAGSWIHKRGWERFCEMATGALANPKRRLLCIGLGLAIILIAPTSSFFPAYEAMAERRVYLALWAAAMAWIALLSSIIKNRGALKAVLSIHLLLLAAVTWRRCHLYQFPEKLWQEAVDRYPENADAQLNLGVAHMRRGHPDEALHAWLHAVELRKLQNPRAYNNIGEIYFQRGEPRKALEYYKEAARQDPGLHYAWRNMGDAYYELGEDASAEESYRQALVLAPDETEVHNNLGLVLERRKNFSQAEKSYQRAIGLDPDFAAAHAHLAELYVVTEQLPQALRHYAIWQALEPGNSEIPQKIALLRRWMSERSRIKK